MEDEGDDQKTLTNSFVDKITLEMLMNKNHYNRYISQNDPKKHLEHVDHLAKVRKYRIQIINTTRDFLDHEHHQITTEVNEAYDNYVRTLIRHFECKEMENPEEFKQDDDMMFGTIDEPEENNGPVMKSFWGKHKVQKKSSSMGFPMNYVPRVQEKTDPEPIDYIV
jgi:hypothetical protein